MMIVMTNVMMPRECLICLKRPSALDGPLSGHESHKGLGSEGIYIHTYVYIYKHYTVHLDAYAYVSMYIYKYIYIYTYTYIYVLRSEMFLT